MSKSALPEQATRDNIRIDDSFHFLPALIQATLRHYGYDTILWGFMAEPPQTVLRGLHPRLGKLVEVGTIYTAIAGLLNILAIYDALEGPAYGAEGEEPDTSSGVEPSLGAGSIRQAEGRA